MPKEMLPMQRHWGRASWYRNVQGKGESVHPFPEGAVAFSPCSFFSPSITRRHK